MQKKYFVFRLLPARPDFATTMTEAEKEIMGKHIEYWKPYFDSGTMLIFGPLMNPSGIYGLGIISAIDEDEAHRLVQSDPALSISNYELDPILAIVSPAFHQ